MDDFSYERLPEPPRELSGITKVFLIVAPLVSGTVAAAGSWPIAPVAAVVAGLVAAAVGALGALLVAREHKTAGVIALVASAAQAGCCGLTGLATVGVQSVFAESEPLTEISAGPDRYLRHDETGFVIGAPEPGFVASPLVARLSAGTMLASGSRVGVWAWEESTYGRSILVAAFRPHVTPEERTVRAFVGGFVAGAVGRDESDAAELVRWDETHHEAWARGDGATVRGVTSGVDVRALYWRGDDGGWLGLLVAYFRHPDDDYTEYLLRAHVPGEWRGPYAPPAGFAPAQATLAGARASFTTSVRSVPHDDAPPEEPTGTAFVRTQYQAPDGAHWAYATASAADAERRPGVLYLVPEIGGLLPADCSGSPAAVLAEAGLAVMIPSFRGEQGNAGHIEALAGEIDDARAALEALRARADVDPTRVVVIGVRDGATLALLLAESAAPALGFYALGGDVDATSFGTWGISEALGPIFDPRVTEEAWIRSPLHFAGTIASPSAYVALPDQSVSAERLRYVLPPGSPLQVISVSGEGGTALDRAIDLIAERIRDPSWSGPLLVEGDAAALATPSPQPSN